MSTRDHPRPQGGNPARIQLPNRPRGGPRMGRAGALKDARLAGYLAMADCKPCGLRTRHLVLRHQLECKRCLTVRRRRPDDPAAP